MEVICDGWGRWRAIHFCWTSPSWLATTTSSASTLSGSKSPTLVLFCLRPVPHPLSLIRSEHSISAVMISSDVRASFVKVSVCSREIENQVMSWLMNLASDPSSGSRSADPTFGSSPCLDWLVSTAFCGVQLRRRVEDRCLQITLPGLCQFSYAEIRSQSSHNLHAQYLNSGCVHCGVSR